MAKQKFQPPHLIQNARVLRQNRTRSEGLRWSILRAKQLCGLNFRQQHPIDVWIVDFACVSEKLVVEIDGGYHDQTAEKDLHRQKCLQERGWHVTRFTDKEVEDDAEPVVRAIAKAIGVTYSFQPRNRVKSGMKTRKPR